MLTSYEVRESPRCNAAAALLTQQAPGLPLSCAPRVEWLPFTIRAVGDDASRHKAVQVRHEAYVRHKLAFADMLRAPEPDDTAANCVLLVAERKSDGAPLGSVRVQFNQLRPLSMANWVTLPAWLAGKSTAEARRLSVGNAARGLPIREALCKAFVMCIESQGAEWAVVAGRRSLARIYEQLLFTDALNGETFIPEPRPNIAHWVLAQEVATVRTRWQQARHPLNDFFFHTDHPDIDITPNPFT